MNGVVIVIIGVVLAIALLLILRLSRDVSGIQQKLEVSRDRRKGEDRRKVNIPVAVERRRQPRRQEEVAATFVRRLEGRHS